MLDGKDWKCELGEGKGEGKDGGEESGGVEMYYNREGQSKMKGTEGGELRTHSENKGWNTLDPGPSPKGNSEKSLERERDHPGHLCTQLGSKPQDCTERFWPRE